MDREGIIRWIEGYCRLKMAKEQNFEVVNLGRVLTDSIRNLPLADNTMVDIVQEQILKIQNKIELEKMIIKESANNLLMGLGAGVNEERDQCQWLEMKETIEVYSKAQENLEKLLGQLMCLYDLSDVLVGILPEERTFSSNQIHPRFFIN